MPNWLRAIIGWLRNIFASPTPLARGPSGPDNYPGDTAFTDILQDIYHGPAPARNGGVSHDKIDLSVDRNPTPGSGGLWTRDAIVAALLARYAAPLTGGVSCKRWLWDTNITKAACVASLTNPHGYPDASGWRAWAGRHEGRWFQDTSPGFVDNARWNPPRAVGSHPPGSPTGTPYDFQPVDFLDTQGNPVRQGWNQSHAGVDYVWGWDPKDEGQTNGRIGAHLGFPHREDGADAIFWFTTREAFFEAVKTVDGVRRRISVGLRGRGQWTIR